MKLAAKTTDELQKIHQEALEQYEDFKSLHLQLNMARGRAAGPGAGGAGRRPGPQ